MNIQVKQLQELIREVLIEIELYSEEALTYQGQAKGFANRQLDKLGMASPEGKDFARRAGSDLLLRNTDRMREFQVQQINTFKRVADAAGMKPE